jgi:hypothetical protein
LLLGLVVGTDSEITSFKIVLMFVIARRVCSWLLRFERSSPFLPIEFAKRLQSAFSHCRIGLCLPTEICFPLSGIVKIMFTIAWSEPESRLIVHVWVCFIYLFILSHVWVCWEIGPADKYRLITVLLRFLRRGKWVETPGVLSRVKLCSSSHSTIVVDGVLICVIWDDERENAGVGCLVGCFAVDASDGGDCMRGQLDKLPEHKG